MTTTRDGGAVLGSGFVPGRAPGAASPFALSERSRRMLIGVHPRLVELATIAITRSPYDFAVSEGVRDIVRQRELVAKGWSHTLQSNHLCQTDGFGHAFDVMAVGDLDKNGVVDAQDKSLTWDPAIYTAIASCVKAVAVEIGVPIRWGGEFKNFFDGPHFELVA